jgi:NTE family protein
MLFRKKVGLALGGGAARGIAHIGVLKVLKAQRIPIDFIAGTSAGSLIAALFAAGVDPNDLEKKAQRLGWMRFLGMSIDKKGPFSGEGIENYIESTIGDLKFYELKIPLAIVSTDLRTWTKVVFKEGRVAEAVRASTSIPGVFSPVKLGDRLIADGGILENVPVPTVKSLGAQVVIAVDVIPVKPLDQDAEHMIEVVDRALDIMLRKMSAPAKAQADFVIEPLTEYISSLDLKQASRLIALGEEAALKIIPKLKRKISWWL